MSLYLRGNDALINNPPTGVGEALSLVGSDWLWAVTGIYLVSFFGLFVLCFSARESDSVFHYLLTLSIFTGAIVYYTEASDLGWSMVGPVDHVGSNSTHQLFYAKYVNWVVAFPSAALALGLLSGVSWTTIFTNIAFCWIWVLTYLAAAYTTSTYKWGFFAFGTFCWLILAMSTLNESREAAQRLGVVRDYMMLSGWANLIWFLYPNAFRLTNSAHVISITNGFIFVGILDVLIMPAWSIAFLLLARNWDYGELRLAFTEHRFDPQGDRSLKGSITAAAGEATASVPCRPPST
ncbi:family A G protein-coupled receptor-like protein [Xylariaceae sp. AK1471]|nr:family A G protein-coupled receptor-like protein [Xylariaceae sp. AK1471]